MTLDELVDKYQDWYDHAGSPIEEAIVGEMLDDLSRLTLG